MAWTAPATATVGQVLTAAWLNTYLRDNMNAVADVITVPAGAMQLTDGAPTLGSQGVAGAWLLDAATTEAVGFAVVVPQGWQTVTPVIWWTNAGGGAGNVVFAGTYTVAGDGEAIGGGSSVGGLGTFAAPVSNTTEKTSGTAFAVTAGELLCLKIQRTGGDAADTLANDIAVWAVEIRRAT